MSTNYRLLKAVPACDLFDGRLEEFGIREHPAADTTEMAKCLTDGRNYLWVYLDDRSFVTAATRYGANVPSKILSAIAEAFDTDIVSEYEPQYWGFDTQEEWDAAWEADARESEKKFYAEVVKYVRGEPSDVRPRTVGEIHAKIAKTLAANDPSLLLVENLDKVIAKVNEIYDRDHAVKVTLTKEQMEFARLLATHEDDLPQA